MAFVYLIRHPHTRQVRTVPTSQWTLSDEGHEQVRRLVAVPFRRCVSAMYTSRQPKTTLVGEAICAAHGIPSVAVEDLGEARCEEWVVPNRSTASRCTPSRASSTRLTRAYLTTRADGPDDDRDPR